MVKQRSRFVVPAQAETHNHRIGFCEGSELEASRYNFSLGVWVPAFAGTTLENGAPPWPERL